MEMQGELPAQESIAACEQSPAQRASPEAGQLPELPHNWTVTMEEEAPGLAAEALAMQCPERAAPEGYKGAKAPEQESAATELLRKLSALHLAGPVVPSARGCRYGDQRRMPLRNDAKLHFHDAKYPEPLSTEESPRRRSRSLPWNTIPEVDVEDDEDSLLCCCKLKKKVQFADTLGLCLASVKHFLPSDEPLVPQAVLARLQSYPPTVSVPRPELHVPEDMCISECPIPADLLARLDEQRVCLEQVSASVWGVNGYVLVKDPGENAQVKIRYTFNDWLSFLDSPASNAQPSPATGTQRFHFNLCYPPATSLIHFALCFTTGHGQEIWDNNHGANYTVSCQQYPLPDAHLSSPEQDECQGPRLW